MAPMFRRKVDDEAAFERLYERHVRDVYRYAVGMLGEAADAEDVTQTTFLNAYRAFQGGTRPEKPHSWLIAIAHNVCRQRFRQAQRRPHEVGFDERIGEADTVPESTAPSAEDLRRALSQLPPNQRAAVVMRELEGCSYAEIADVLGISVSALETLLFRARRALREQLEEQLTCQEAAFAINKQIDGRLSMSERRGLRAHLRACSECHSLAQSQRAQRRALKALVLVPLPATFSHWIGNQTAAAATGTAGAGGLAAVGATTGGGAAAGASSLLAGGVAAKVAAVVVTGVVVGSGTYAGVTRDLNPLSKHAQPAVSSADGGVAPIISVASKNEPIQSALVFETPKTVAPRSAAPLHARQKLHVRVLRHVRATKAKRVARGRTDAVPPGQLLRAAHSPKSNKPENPQVVPAATAAGLTHGAQAPGRVKKTTTVERTPPTHPTKLELKVKAKAKPKPTPPVQSHSKTPPKAHEQQVARGAHAAP